MGVDHGLLSVFVSSSGCDLSAWMVVAGSKNHGLAHMACAICSALGPLLSGFRASDRDPTSPSRDPRIHPLASCVEAVVRFDFHLSHRQGC